jgi:elongation factor Ts|tara:strand:+ start:768 stop:1634 length:867 start_codon:yes stop_codon:yes gene_type:complete
MSNKDLLGNIKKLRELTGVGFKDCKLALDESKGDIEKSIEFLRKKGIAKASKKMSRTASEGLALVKEEKGEVSIIEINSETDFVAKNKDFISFCRELSDINFITKGDLEKLNNSKMQNNNLVKDCLVSLIAKIGEKISIRRANFFDNKKGFNFFYVHSAVEKNIGKIISIVKIDGIVKGKNDDIGNKISMHIAASSPIAIDKDNIKKDVVEKELEIIKAEVENSGKPKEMVEKISKGKITKFINDSTLINQIWIMDPKKKVSDILNENKIDKEVKILDFIRYKVGEGV